MDNKQKEEEDNEKTGALWPEDKSIVVDKGICTLNGKKRYCAIIESYSLNGQPKLEFMVSCGLIYKNEQHQKITDDSPDFGGAITLDKESFKLGLWNKVSKNNQPYKTLSMKVKETPAKKEPTLDDVPF